MRTSIRRTKTYERLTRHEIVVQFIKYAMVGCLNVAISIAIYLALRSLGLGPLLANAVAFVISSINSFILNKLWSFRDTRSEAVVRQYFVFVFFTLVALGLNTGIFRLLLIPLGDYGRIGEIMAVLASLPISALWNFTSYRRWTFNRPPRASSV